MRTTMIAILCLVLASLSSVPAQPPKRSLAGDWTVVSAIDDGKPLPAEVLSKSFIRGTGTTLVPVEDGKELSDERLDLKFLDGNKVDFTQRLPAKDGKGTPALWTKPGLLEFVDDNTVKVAWAEGPTQKQLVRPANFDGGVGSMAMVLKRKTK